MTYSQMSCGYQASAVRAAVSAPAPAAGGLPPLASPSWNTAPPVTSASTWVGTDSQSSRLISVAGSKPSVPVSHERSPATVTQCAHDSGPPSDAGKAVG